MRHKSSKGLQLHSDATAACGTVPLHTARPPKNFVHAERVSRAYKHVLNDNLLSLKED